MTALIKNRPEKRADEDVAVKLLALQRAWTIREFSFLILGRLPPERGFNPGVTIATIAQGIARAVWDIEGTPSTPISELPYSADHLIGVAQLGFFGGLCESRVKWLSQFRKEHDFDTFAERVLTSEIEKGKGVEEERAKSEAQFNAEVRTLQAKRRTKQTLKESAEKMQTVADVLKAMPKASKTEQAIEIAVVAKISPSTANRWLKNFDDLPPEVQNLYKGVNAGATS